MSKKAKDNGTDAVAAARAALAEAQAKLAAHDRETTELKAQAEQLEQALDAAVLAGQGDAGTKASRDLAAIKEFLAAKIRTRKILAQAVTDGEAAHRGAQQHQAEGAYQAEGRELHTHDVKIAEVLETIILPEIRAKADRLQRMRGLVNDYGLPHTLPQHKILLPERLLKQERDAIEVLTDALDLRRVYGMS